MSPQFKAINKSGLTCPGINRNELLRTINSKNWDQIWEAYFSLNEKQTEILILSHFLIIHVLIKGEEGEKHKQQIIPFFLA